MGGVGDALVAVEMLLCSNIVVQHPIVVSHTLEQKSVHTVKISLPKPVQTELVCCSK